MQLLNKLTYNNLKLNKKRTIIGIIGIVLSVALLTAVSAFASSAKDSFTEFVKKDEGNFHYMFYDVAVKDLDDFKYNRDIESYYYLQELGYARLNESKNDNKPYAYVIFYDKAGIKDIELNLKEGRLPENENEILIPSHVITNGRVKLKVGDTITLEVGKRMVEEYTLSQSNPYQEEEERIENAATHTYTIVGIMSRPTYKMEPYTAPGYTFVTVGKMDSGTVNVFARMTKEALKNKERAMAGILDVSENAFDIYYNSGKYYDNLGDEEFLKLVQNAGKELEQAKYAFDLNSELIRLESVPTDNGLIRSLIVVAVIVIVIIIISSVFCIRNLFLISTTEKVKQYGILASVGATRKQIKKSVLTEATFMGIVGIPLGVLLGLLATAILVYVCNLFLVDLAGMVSLELIFSVSYLSIIVAVILGIVTIYLSAIKSANMAARLTPLDAIRATSDIKVNSKKIKCPKIIAKIFNIGGVISYKNMKRNKKKYKTAVISICICVATFIPLSYFVSLVFSLTEMAYSDYSYDMAIYESSSNTDDFGEKIKEIAALDKVKGYSIARGEQLLIKDEKYITDEYKKIVGPNYFVGGINEAGIEHEDAYYSMQIWGLDMESYSNYVKSLGLDTDYTKDKAILLNSFKGLVYNAEPNSTNLASVDILNVKVGESVAGYFDFDGMKNERLLQIAAVTDKAPVLDVSDQRATLIVSEEYYDTLVENDSDYIRNLFLLTDDNVALSGEIEEILNGMDYTVMDIKEQVQATNSLYTIVAIFMYGFIIVIALIGITNIINTINTSMELRSREFATLKSLGMTKKEFNHMINLESIFIGTKALVIGETLGLILAYLLNYVLTRSVFASFVISFEAPILAVIGSAVFVYVLLLAIMKFAVNKINKKNIIDTIRNENI